MRDDIFVITSQESYHSLKVRLIRRNMVFLRSNTCKSTPHNAAQAYSCSADATVTFDDTDALSSVRLKRRKRSNSRPTMLIPQIFYEERSVVYGIRATMRIADCMQLPCKPRRE